MQDGFDLSTIIFACLAIFIIWKLRSVLGQKTGNEQPPQELNRDNTQEPHKDSWQNQSNMPPPRADNDQVITLPPRQPAPVSQKDRWKGIAEEGSQLADTLDRVVGLEPSFDIKAFLEGAKVAYEMIVVDFAKGNREELKNLLTDDVYRGFDQAIKAREKAHETAETTFVSIDKSELMAAELSGRDAQLTIRFIAKMITVTRDEQGNIVDGSPDEVVDTSDIWTFSRTLGSDDPTWLLAATESGQ
ncbi:Tim44/TimA family putative adaptor protein [Microvirga sp. W0021]|uniref:Tim44/TimA family putative adaptor protein n=1 Tax=Hohaiivirga grylli TaxID=3133970 RepID=A0ABV0BJB4_9HYPH